VVVASRHTGAYAGWAPLAWFLLGRRGQEWKNVKRQELGNELRSSQHLGLQSVSSTQLDIPTVPAHGAEVQFKKSIAGIVQSFVILSQSFVILSGVTASQGEAVAQSKDP